MYAIFIFFFNDPATTEIYTLSLHDALPISTSTEPVASTGTSVPLTGTWTVSPMRSRPPLTRARAKGRAGPAVREVGGAGAGIRGGGGGGGGAAGGGGGLWAPGRPGAPCPRERAPKTEEGGGGEGGEIG